jgi:hypothetical protein
MLSMIMYGMFTNPAEECHRLRKIIGRLQIDTACVGIGESRQLAFNDPPAHSFRDSWTSRSTATRE